MTPIELMRKYIAAVQRGDRDTAFAYFADDVVGHVPGRSAMAGELRGRDAVMGYIQTAVAHAKGAVEVELIDMLASEERVALLVREWLGGKDGGIDIRRANVYTVRDGRIVEIWIYEGDQYAVDAYFSDVPASA